MSSAGIDFVDSFTVAIKKLLMTAKDVQSNGGIEPAITSQDLGEGIREVEQQSPGATNPKYAAIETACRKIFYDLLVSPHAQYKGLKLNLQGLNIY